MMRSVRTAWLVILALLAGCSDSSNDQAVNEILPFQELYDQGVDRYLGVYSPMASDTTGDGVTIHRFGGTNGPLCYTGGQFTMSTRAGNGEDLLIFLQGGGACGPTSCSAVSGAPPGILSFGMLNPNHAENPAADFDVAYLPYCDGSLWTGDNDVDSDGDGVNDRFFRGMHNLSASMDVVANTFPAPRRILIAGNSAGGFGTHIALPLIRKIFPDVPIELINDSGVGILNPGSQVSLNEYWNSGSVFPASCEDCIGDDGNLTGYHAYQLGEDGNLRMGFISSKQDQLISEQNLMISGPAFEAQLVSAVAELEEAYPQRFRSLVPSGNEHTFVLKQFGYPVADTTVSQWVADMLGGGDGWVSVTE